MVGGRSLALRRSVRESAAAAIGAWENTNPLYVQTRSREAGCLAREGPRYRGRGEAAGDCVVTAEPCRTAAVDRTVARALAASLNSIYCSRRGLRPRPGPWELRQKKDGEHGNSLKARSSDRLWVRKPVELL